MHLTSLVCVAVHLDLLDDSCEAVDEAEDGHLLVLATDSSSHPQDRPDRDLDLDRPASLEVDEGGGLVLQKKIGKRISFEQTVVWQDGSGRRERTFPPTLVRKSIVPW